MSQSGPVLPGAAFRGAGMVEERLRAAKNSAVASAMGKSEDWARKVLAGDSGILLSDLPRLLEVLQLKVVDRAKVAVHPELVQAYEAIVRRAVADHDLLQEDQE